MENQFNKSELISIKNMSLIMEQNYLERKNETKDKDVKIACDNLIKICKDIIIRYRTSIS